MINNILMIIAAVFIVTIAFGILIIRQFGSFEKKAQKAKIRQEEYLREYKAQKKAEAERQQALDQEMLED
jgi:hypothetical protein